jgi:hypothetical protein
MRHHIGVLLQIVAMTLLLSVMFWQLDFGIRLIWMPAVTVVGIVVFYIGYRLREG